MDIQKIAAIGLIVIGALGLGYGGFSYAQAIQWADVGPVHVSADEGERVNVPVWAGVGAIVLMLVSRRRS